MKRMILVAGLVLWITSAAGAVDFWHSGTMAAPQGQCAAQFTFDAGPFDTVQKLTMDYALINKQGKAVSPLGDLIEVGSFGGSEAQRYTVAFVVNQAACGNDLTLKIITANGIIDGKNVDLISEKKLHSRDFKPFKIKMK